MLRKISIMLQRNIAILDVLTKQKCITIVDIYLHVKLLGGFFFSFDIHYREPSVERLNYHLEGEQSVMY